MANHKLNNFSFRIAVFLALLNHKFKPERNIESPFETQNVIMATFVISILVYAITLCTPYFPGAIDDINFLAGRLATVLLTFTLFPRLGWLLLFSWTIHFVKLIYRAVRKFRQQYHATPSAFDLFNQCRHAHHNEQSNRGSANNNLHASLVFAIGLLLALMPLKYPQKTLETHSATVSIFITLILVYAAAWETEHHLQTNNSNSSIHRIIVTKISLFTGSLATVVLVLLIVPAIGWFILFVWTFFLVKQIYEAWQMFDLLYRSTLWVTYVFYPVFDLPGHYNQAIRGLPV
ncbi:hypothetical protein ERO13_D10G235408v2 [Gossypium hirsutum]|uniref:Uncharacterized protein n=3 Tax=Gossypium TaxID=3633 RepID=A0A5J5PWY0_GOSBA|nr:hypothetical protein ES319_D10G280300v1 [Gossypium barbadense]KAG4127897.1 hypothetical protein ERO13_D10G235408v2 [Gossypium hirsutum]TYH51778.1 hypothetical protein ES332_D10G301900v1 [Gossypium tomentosum]TYI62819.1 hypothetical protein E1A91_D10G273400v1 [Gossypium mustelinum]